MAERIPFNPEEEHKTRDWRNAEPGDFLWHVPDPDENGTVDPDEIELFIAAKPEGDEAVDPSVAFVFRKWSPATAAQKKNLYLAESRTSVEEAMEIALCGVERTPYKPGDPVWYAPTDQKSPVGWGIVVGLPTDETDCQWVKFSKAAIMLCQTRDLLPMTELDVKAACCKTNPGALQYWDDKIAQYLETNS